MFDITFSIIIACIIALFFNKPLEKISDNLTNISNEYIKNFKEKQKINYKTQINNIKLKENTKLDPTFKNIATFFLSILSGIFISILIISTLGIESYLIIIALIIILSIIEGIIKSPYRGIILSILFIGGIIIFILLYVHRYDIMLYKIMDEVF